MLPSGHKSFFPFIPEIGSLLGILTLAGALIVAGNTPGDGMYEVSIYQAYSPLFWALIFLTIGIGAVSAFYTIFLQTDSYQWLSGFLLIAAANLLVLLLQYLRHYAFAGQWDDVNHFSSALNILEYGYPDAENFYPSAHVLAAGFSLLTGMNLQEVILIFPALFYLIYLANVVFAAWELDPRPGVRGLMLVLAAPLGYHTFGTIFRPTHFAVYMLPHLIGWLYRARLRQKGWIESIPFVLVLLFLPFLHPWAVISSGVLLIGFGLAFLYTHPEHAWSRTNFSTSLIILFVTWWAWFTTFEIFGVALKRLARSFIEGLAGSHSLADYLNKSQQVGLPFGRIFSLILYTYGPTLLYIGFAGIAIVWVASQLLHRNRKVEIHVIALALFTIVFMGTSALTLFRDLIAGSPLRISNFVFSATPLLVSALFYDFLTGAQKTVLTLPRKVLLGSTLLVGVVGVAIVGTLGTYYSQRTGQPSHQLSYAQQAGLEFLTEKAIADDKGIYMPFGGSFMLSSVLSKDDLAQLRERSPRWWIQVSPSHLGYEWLDILPANFGYGIVGLGTAPEDAGYLAISAYEKAYYTEIWPQGGSLTSEDFETLEMDPIWCQIYTSYDLTLWRKCNGE